MSPLSMAGCCWSRLEPPQYTLADLLAGVTEANRHHEVETGGPVGLEVW
jgi:antitoxin component of MazEF toxin-antitoxin module